jgi:hypothetical protein
MQLVREYVMVHHSLTKDGTSKSWPAIRRYHMEQGWNDIGYHAGVELVSDHLEAMLGRPEDQVAAACKEDHMNARALHLCIVGNFDLTPPSDTVLSFAARVVVKPWLERYGLGSESIIGHRDRAHYKSCPGFMFDLDRLRMACA